MDGESIADSDKGDEEDEKPVDDEEDDGFFVPHGHLSDDEIDDEDEKMVPAVLNHGPFRRETKTKRKLAKPGKIKIKFQQ